MFKVECEGCSAPYQVDERRVPPTGLKMRCPKCGASFVVHKPGEEEVPLPALASPKAHAPAPRVTAAMGAAAAAELPAVAAKSPPRPPVPAAKAPAAGSDLDLPAALGAPSAKSPMKATMLGLGKAAATPQPVTPPAQASPAPVPTAPASSSFGEIDLPSPPVGLPAPVWVQTPTDLAPRAARENDLPAILSAGLPEVTKPGLPARSGSDLPSPAVAAGLPTALSAGLPAPSASLPARSTRSFGEIDLPLLTPEAPALSASLPVSHGGLSGPPALAGGLPAPSAALPTGSISLPGGSPSPPAQGGAAQRARISAMPEFSLGSEPPPPVADEDWSFSDPALEAPRVSSQGVAREAGGGASFGELNLGDEAALGATELALGSTSAPPVGDDDMEFGGIPQEAEVGRSISPALAPAPTPSRKPSRAELAPAPRPGLGPTSAGKIAAAGIALLAVAGASLEVLTPYGAFGRHLIFDALNADKFAQQQAQSIDGARKLLATDTFGNTNQAIGYIDAAHARLPRIPGLLAYGAFVGYVAELRFGRGPIIDAHAKQLLAEIPTEKTPAYADLARAAGAAVESQLPRAKQIVDTLADRDKQDVDVAILAGEVALLVQEPQRALELFTRAGALDGASPRSTFGVARADAALGKHDAAVTLAKKVLEQSPQHVGARLLIARSLWSGSRDEAGTTSTLMQVISAGPTRDAASPLEIVDALTTMARVHMARSRMSQAEAALTEALKIDPKAGPALAGMGEVLYREGRFTDALARFEAGIQADPEGTAAKIGAAKTKIALERLAEAKDQLRRLRDARPNDPEVIYWIGRVEDALGDKAAAEKAYTDAIALTAGKPDAIDAYVSLSQLLASEGRPADAQAKLVEARKTLPASAAIYRAIADVDLVAGRYDAAREGYEAALKMDANDLASLFKLGVTLRRMNRFDPAQAQFDRVAELDKEYPGLALERGLLYEASNRAGEALEFYQQALAKAPDDPDMMLRVGSAEVVAGHASQAEDRLRKVISKRPNSAEVNHYLGRALLLKGTNLAEALRYLKRAVELDANRAEYHLYVGWAANEAGQPAVAQDELVKALQLDKGLADAYWQKGVMLRKEGAVIDAVKNLQKALELRPSRFEAYATLAECYEDENKTSEAIAAWKRAISSDGSQPEWHYRLGKLLGRSGESELREAVTLSESTENRPGWLAQAYFELGELERAGGKRADAIAHLRRFLALAKVDSPYRADARKALAALGANVDEGTQ
jgi:predicted Zn finger-like uncharacterized protein